MSEKLCTLRTKGGGGGRYNETSLWTNSAPTSNFNAQTVILSQGMSNYKYIKIVYAFDKNSSGQTNIEDVIYPVDDFRRRTNGSSDWSIVEDFASGGYRWTRVSGYISDTSISIGNCYRWSGSTAGTAQNQAIIPLEILGLNELDHGKRFDETTLWTNNAPTSNFAASDITLSDDVDNYDYIKFTCRYSTSNSATLSELCTLADFKSTLNTTSNNMRFAVASIASSLFAARCLSYISDTSARISAAFTASGTDNSRIIPLSIVGCKFR